MKTFICQLTLIPELTYVLSNERQMDDMKNFLLEEGNSVMMGAW